MLDRYQCEIQRKLKKEHKKFIGKTGIAFGCSAYIKTGLEELTKYGIRCSYVVDNDTAKQGKIWNGLPVIGVKDLQEEAAREYTFLVCGNALEEKMGQLLQNGYKKSQLVVIARTERNFTTALLERIHAYVIYERMIKRFRGKKLLFTPCPCSGDAYIVGMYMKSYLTEHYYENIWILVVNNSVRKVFALFGYQNVTVISEKEADELIAVLDLFGEAATGISYLSHRGLSCQVMVPYEPCFKATFREMIRELVLDIHEEGVITLPQFACDVYSTLQADGIWEGKTVVLSPYANTFYDERITAEWWEKLAAELEDMGYMVCTNSMGEDEPVVRGTKRVAWKYSEIVPLLDRAGYFIGLRNGLCDVISSASCKKVILYQEYLAESLENYFSLKAMGLCDDAVELAIGNDTEALRKQILSCIEDIIMR